VVAFYITGDAVAKAVAMDQPVFVLSTGGRTGSTLVQRLFISTHRVLVWGEHNGLLGSRLFDVVRGMENWTVRQGRGQLAYLDEHGYQGFIPNVNPGAAIFAAATRRFFDASLGKEAYRRGYRRWGFKEIRYGREEALFLQQLYPEAAFVLVFRNPRDCLRSIKSTTWYKRDFGGDPRKFLQNWGRLSEELLSAAEDLRRCCAVRYEQLIEDHEGHIGRLAKIAGIGEDLFDRAVFSDRARGTACPPKNLDAADVAALASDKLRRIAEKLGYGGDTPAVAGNGIAEPGSGGLRRATRAWLHRWKGRLASGVSAAASVWPFRQSPDLRQI
jgi:hypothetical protein